MNDNTKIEVAREIMNAMIADACKKGFNPASKRLNMLLKDEEQMEKFNFKIIDKILKKYSKFIKGSKC